MALTPEEHQWLKDTRDRVIAGVNQQPARPDQRVADVGDVLAINDAIIKATQAQSDVTRQYLTDRIKDTAPADLATQINAAGIATQVRDELVKLIGGK